MRASLTIKKVSEGTYEAYFGNETETIDLVKFFWDDELKCFAVEKKFGDFRFRNTVLWTKTFEEAAKNIEGILGSRIRLVQADAAWHRLVNGGE